MTPTLIEISDVSIRLWKNGALLCDSPSVAHVEGTSILFGEQALAKSRSEPQGFCALHWSRVDLTPLHRANRVARHHADLIYRHLEYLHAQHGPLEDIVFIVPSDLNYTQLALLLGIAQSLKLGVVGLVDAAVANVINENVDFPSVQFLELGQFRTTISKVSINDHARFESTQSIERAGQDYLSNLSVKWIADCFLDQARFDPLHQAQTEQIIFDHIDSWIESLSLAPNINVEIEHLGRRHGVSLSRSALLEVLSSGVKSIVEAIDSKLPIVLSQRFNKYPSEVFNDLGKQTRLVKKSSLEVFAAVEERLQEIVCSADEISFVRELDITVSRANEELTQIEQVDEP